MIYCWISVILQSYSNTIGFLCALLAKQEVLAPAAEWSITNQWYQNNILSRELTYPLPRRFWRWFSLLPWWDILVLREYRLIDDTVDGSEIRSASGSVWRLSHASGPICWAVGFCAGKSLSSNCLRRFRSYVTGAHSNRYPNCPKMKSYRVLLQPVWNV